MDGLFDFTRCRPESVVDRVKVRLVEDSVIPELMRIMYVGHQLQCVAAASIIGNLGHTDESSMIIQHVLDCAVSGMDEEKLRDNLRDHVLPMLSERILKKKAEGL